MTDRSTMGSSSPGHVAERYGLLAIIALGEGVIGTVASVSALVESQGWSAEAVLVVVAGIGLTFGLWWIYFMVPAGALLARYRGRAFVWGYSHIVVYAAIAATGAGLHVAAIVIEGHSELGALGAIVAVAVPVLIFVVAVFALYTYLVRLLDLFHILLSAAALAALCASIVLAASGASLGLCLLLVTLAPAIIVVGYETIGHRHQAERMSQLIG